MDEIETAQAWNMALADYWLLPREDRKLMVGLCKGQRVMSAIAKHEYDKELERQAKRRAKKRGKR